MSALSRIAFTAALLASSSALAQGFGGPTQSADPGGLRFDIDVGALAPQFSRFRYGDIRVGFPVGGNPFLADLFNERGRSAAFNIGGRIAYGLPTPVFGAPLEIYGRFNYYRAERTSEATEFGVATEAYVPYIDGQVRTTLGGGSIVGLFVNSVTSLDRKLTSYDVEGGVRQQYAFGSWNVSPAVFFNYQRLQQRDSLVTSVSTDPPAHTLTANVNSDHFRIGGAVRASHPVGIPNLIVSANVAGGVEIVRARYNGAQTFGPSGTFDTAFEQFASASDSRTRIGGFVGGEAGFVYWLFPYVSVSVMGNARYITSMPYVRYPTPITGTLNVSGPANIGFQGQFVYGGLINFSIKM